MSDRRPTAPSGLVVVDKPGGWTSHDVVARVRRLAGTRRVGHAGTLDPMATGVLVLGVERATRLLTYVVGADKEYLATVRLGVTTTTDDAEGETVATADARHVTDADVLAAVEPLTGEILQVPSSVSAIKVDGRRAYARVRAGEDVELAARPVTVRIFEVLDVRPGGDQPVVDVDVRVVCSSGTYVRALARDVGAALGVGGHLTALRRTRVGPYGLDVARTLEQLEEGLTVLPLADAARRAFPVREVDEREASALSHGRRIASSDVLGTPEAPVAALGPDGTLVALLVDEAGTSRPTLVLAPA
ncbi:tRNA pseudouridine(55) synthase TruB [Cellulomonas carbonis]|uniref:tRNA pseudouridine synthase B n=1 Tax=Cellulomonas carbonis T26 TaxID=947969 RepID=A0A0A0BNI4_9CELL|nr:tRNA pseudouridine(55) synthase TruB [Cellulomonas carbonis]KGM09207.1 tRNA pseudouridine synthase B [Cellulomonas carbonis T26]GGB97634.1 tRNA pseudouridine synthase B [Cellulomonas carbonis]